MLLLERVAVFLDPPQPLVHIFDDLLGAGHPDHLACPGGVGPQLAAGLGGDQDVSVLRDGLNAAGGEIRASHHLADLTSLGGPVHREHLRAQGIVMSHLVDFGLDPECFQGHRGAQEDLGTRWKQFEEHPAGFLPVLRDQGMDAIGFERPGGPFDLGITGQPGESRVGDFFVFSGLDTFDCHLDSP